jgi:hypothetical protein
MSRNKSLRPKCPVASRVAGGWAEVSRMSVTRSAHIALLICALTAGLDAQVAAAGYDDPCGVPLLNPVRSCPYALPPAKGAPNTVADKTKAAFECEWIDPRSVDHVLAAFKLLKSSPPPPDLTLKVLSELNKGGYPVDQSFFRAAMGDPDTDPNSDQYGHLRAQGLSNVLDLIAKANRLTGDGNGQGADSQKIQLFECTKDRIDDVFDAQPCDPGKRCATGPTALERVNDAFSQKNNYVALYELLDAAWQQSDEGDLEKLRAAFALDPDLLAKQVAAKIAASKN